MLTCIVCTKQNGTCGARGRGVAFHDPDDDDDIVGTPITRHPIKLITSQIKDVAVKASGAYRHCKPCSGSTSNNQRRHQRYGASEKFHYSYRRAGETISAGSTPMAACLVKEGMDSSAEATPSMSGRTTDGVNGVAGGGVVSSPEEETKEWVAQVEPGVLITLLSLPDGGNDLKRIRFSREMFSKWQAQRWWSENYDKVMELYNVQRFNHQSVPLPTTSRSEEEEESLTKMESVEPSSVTPTRRNLHRLENDGGTDHVELATSTPKLSKAENSSSARTTISSHEDVDRSDEISISNASEQETEWVEQDEPGVYITIRALPGGVRELRRVRFSRERFGEMHARMWWEENRARIHEQYL